MRIYREVTNLPFLPLTWERRVLEGIMVKIETLAEEGIDEEGKA